MEEWFQRPGCVWVGVPGVSTSRLVPGAVPGTVPCAMQSASLGICGGTGGQDTSFKIQDSRFEDMSTLPAEGHGAGSDQIRSDQRERH